MSNAVPIRAVAFDMDGLLLNTEDLYEEVGASLMLRRGKTYRDEVRRKMMGLPAQFAFQVLIDAEELTDTWEVLQREAEVIFEQMLRSRVALLPGVQDLLDYLDRNQLPRCVATSSQRAFAEAALQVVGILNRFDFIVTAADVTMGKPAPDIYLEAARRMNVRPAEMLVLEDSENGTRAGVSSGARVIAVPNRHTMHSDFQSAFAVASEGLTSKVIFQVLGDDKILDRANS